jgi:hypothetical protein
VTGTVDEVRSRLATALEQMGFHVVDEQPLMARRRIGAMAQYGGSWNPLQNPASVTVGLKQVGGRSVRAVFTYSVRAPWLGSGDRAVIGREVDALVALAVRDASGMACEQCGAALRPGGKYCRECGASSTPDQPTELELVRLAAATREAMMATWVALVLGVLAVVAGVLVGFTADASKAERMLTVLTWMCAGLGVSLLGWSLYSLRAGLVAGGSSSRNAEIGEPAPADTTGRLEMPQRALEAPPSVVEGTTELLEREHAAWPKGIVEGRREH